MKEYIVNLQSFRVQAESKQEAREKVEGVLKRCAYQPVIEDIEDFRNFINAVVDEQEGDDSSD